MIGKNGFTLIQMEKKENNKARGIFTCIIAGCLCFNSCTTPESENAEYQRDINVIELLRNDGTSDFQFEIDKINPEGNYSRVKIAILDNYLDSLYGLEIIDDQEIKKLFSNGEIESYLPTVLDKKTFINERIISEDTLVNWRNVIMDSLTLNPDYNKPVDWMRYFHISAPIFSSDGDFVYFEVDYHSGGSSQGKTFVFKKEKKGTWKKYYDITRWVS